MDPCDARIEVLKAVLEVLGSLLITFLSIVLLLAWKERIKRREELDSELRRLRYEALIEVLEKLGTCHMKKAWMLRSDPELRDVDKVQTEFNDFIALLATKEFMIGTELFGHVRGCAEKIGVAKQTEELNKITDEFERELECWIPPLTRDVRRRRRRSEPGWWAVLLG
ncbi:MAG: hypothetical protein ABSA12_08740 [Verrucomicrobiia bacterium]|jgi:hypothetical protein